MMNLGDRATRFGSLIRDRDSKFSAAFDAVFTAEAIQIIRTPVRAPQANAIAERWIGSLRRELLDRTLIVNRRHLERVLAVYVDHYNTHRPHRSLGQTPPIQPSPGPNARRRPRRPPCPPGRPDQRVHVSAGRIAGRRYRNAHRGSGDAVETAAAAAEGAGVHIQTVGVGTTAGTTVEVDGYRVRTALDEARLTALAETSGGSYHPAADAAELERIASTIDLRLTTQRAGTCQELPAGQGHDILHSGERRPQPDSLT